MTYILILWTVVAASNSAGAKYDWRPIGEFSSEATCISASKLMGANPDTVRCLKK